MHNYHRQDLDTIIFPSFFPAVLVLVLHCFYHHTVFDFDWFYFILEYGSLKVAYGLTFMISIPELFWSWSCTAYTTTQHLILSDLISFSNFGHQSDIYLPKWWVELSSSSRETIDFFLLQFKKKFMITLDSSQSKQHLGS